MWFHICHHLFGGYSRGGYFLYAVPVFNLANPRPAGNTS
ncbi:hypothetical protein EVA_06546 [gut metagenome]|uniref:Uncharacterized protein n=1 Tax=gut metagenome TaxID=749906 RepID=J9GEL4_9ZZZZ